MILTNQKNSLEAEVSSNFRWPLDEEFACIKRIKKEDDGILRIQEATFRSVNRKILYTETLNHTATYTL
jgi:hypothetical protein